MKTGREPKTQMYVSIGRRIVQMQDGSRLTLYVSFMPTLDKKNTFVLVGRLPSKNLKVPLIHTYQGYEEE
jgi:hypothetical protein